MTAPGSSVVRDGQIRRVSSAELVCGDILVLAEGDAVAADGRLVEAASLQIDEASLTGESTAELKDTAVLQGAVALGDRCNMVFMGTTVLQGSGRAVVTACGMATEMGAIAGMLTGTTDEQTPLEKEVGRIGKMLGIAVVIIAAVVMGSMFLAVAAVPEGLPAILSVVLALGVQRMARHNAVVKNLSSVETLGAASVIASDKTGTLTRAQMTIERIITASGETLVTGIGYQPEGRVEYQGANLPAGAMLQETIVMLGGGSLAGNAELHQGATGGWEQHGDPTEVAFLVAEQKLGTALRRKSRFERVGESGFTSERKFMSVLALDNEHDGACMLIAKGAPDVLLGRCNWERVGMQVVKLDAARRGAILASVDRLSDAALRTLAVAYRPLGAMKKCWPRNPWSTTWSSSVPWACSTRHGKRRPWRSAKRNGLASGSS
jgi:Ca2+-transporting ATPase